MYDFEDSLRAIPKYKEDARSSLSGSANKLYFILIYLKENPNQQYHGKKKCHTIKNNLITNDANHILYLSDSYQGSAHDKRIAQEARLQFPDDTYLLQDLGYVGFAPENVTVLMLKKNYKTKQLSSYEQEVNWLIGKVRVKVEHVMTGIKRLKIVKEKIRLKSDEIKNCALHNLRVQFRGNNILSE